jgi:hypothetical protein
VKEEMIPLSRVTQAIQNAMAAAARPANEIDMARIAADLRWLQNIALWARTDAVMTSMLQECHMEALRRYA